MSTPYTIQSVYTMALGWVCLLREVTLTGQFGAVDRGIKVLLSFSLIVWSCPTMLDPNSFTLADSVIIIKTMAEGGQSDMIAQWAEHLPSLG